MDPNKGEVLGMASNQEFDLNDPGSLEGIMSDEEYEENSKTADGLAKISEARSRLWRNFCVSDSYEPGSTFKSVTVASALEESVIRTSDSFYCGGYTQVDVWRIGCNNKSGHGYVSTAQALMKSCNCALMGIADKLGPQNFLKYQLLFGFGEKTGIDLPSETTGILIPEKKFNMTLDSMLSEASAYIFENSGFNIEQIITTLPETNQYSEFIVKAFRINTPEIYIQKKLILMQEVHPKYPKEASSFSVRQGKYRFPRR